jgi:predicted metal-dependent HD superfamily phosphohydrolase
LIPEPLIEALRARYSERGRHYHSWGHIEALLRHYRRWEAHFRRPAPVLWALYWHDAIYDPQAKDNEEQSAVLLEREAQGHLPTDDIAFAATIVRATTAHEVPGGLGHENAKDTALFLDLDLSILGAPIHVYDRYETDIRKEYAFVPEPAFRAGRGAILKAFLARERLYLTNLAHAEWDAPARANLTRAMAALETPV